MLPGPIEQALAHGLLRSKRQRLQLGRVRIQVK
jgi:hypothetical protein